MKFSRLALKLALAAHILAWVAYLPIAFGFVLWPALRGQAGEEWGVLATVFVPVSLTGLGVLTVASRHRRAEGKAASATLAALLLAFCVVGIFAVSQVHLPVEAMLLLGMAIGSFSIIGVANIGGVGSLLFLLFASLLSLGFCVLAMFSVGIFFVPAALTLLAAALVFAFQAGEGGRRATGGQVSTLR